jgi:LPS sulfotransferase NodH
MNSRDRLTQPVDAPRNRYIAMFHIGRSGSRVLADILNQHPQVYWDGEIYERLIQDWEKKGNTIGTHGLPVDPIEHLQQRMTGSENTFFGFEVKFFHLRLAHITLQHFIEHLYQLGFSHFIILKRKNALRKIVSSVIAHKNAQYHISANEKTKKTRIELDIDNVQIDRDAKPLVAYLQDYEKNFRKLEMLLKDQQVLQLTYEDDISANPYVGYQKICHFLEITPQAVSIRYGKTNPFTLAEMLINFTEVEHLFNGTPFEWMLYE